ncbi:hypothetical protein BST26_12340 [Mycolicibacterium insubricum]|uniref:Alpha/beta hydrolase n=1 Tax=Mycolicibacterium insubricum TaxID=444597 RepID=A0A1X0DCK4_9MYCO|nr:hypothetical protein BST26_12340 [Mycolicibacterium insubricum]
MPQLPGTPETPRQPGAHDGAGYRSLYTGPHRHRVLDGIGHNVPQEAPAQFASAVVDVATLS